MRILLVIYDNESYIHWFPQGLGYIAAVLKSEGHEVIIYNQDLHHYPDEHLTRYLDNNLFDAIGFSFIGGYYQYKKAIKISNAINASKKRPYYIIGGHGPAPEPKYFLEKTHADAVVIGEGELTIVELLQALQDKKSLKGIKGIAYRDGDVVVINERRPLITDIDSIPIPAYELFPIEYYRLLRMPHATSSDFIMPVLSGRGCTFKCTFCYRMDKGFRPRSHEYIVEEIKFLIADYGITYITFSDELLMSSIERVESLCEYILQQNISIKWDCNGRLNYAKPKILQLMKRAGCVFINYRIEAMDDLVLKNMKKSLTTKQIIRGVEATLDAGISPGYNIIFGNIGDNVETLTKGVDFLIQYDDGAQMRTIRPVTPYPGSPLYYTEIEQGLLKGCEDFYENKHINSDLVAINFTDMSDDQFHKCLFDANSKLLSNYSAQKLTKMLADAKSLYLEKNAAFRGYRQA